VFHGLGLLPGECTINIDHNVLPVVHPPRRVPHSVVTKLKDEIDGMKDLGVISKVTTPTPWVNSLVVAEKPSGGIRVCLDPRNLNKAVLRPHYPMRSLDDVLPMLTNANYLTKLDARSSY
jgi:hypothetical protein